MEQKRSIAIIGAKGNVGNSAVNALINNSNYYGPENIFPVTRDYRENPSNYSRRINQCDTVFLTVKPSDAVEALDGLRGDLKEGVALISCVSGLGVNIISEMLGISHDQIIKMTLNINIEYKTGIIMHNTPDNLIEIFNQMFEPLCLKTIRKRSKRITDGISYIGSGDATVAQYIWLRVNARRDIPFRNAVEELNMDDLGVKNYVRVMRKACLNVFHNDVFDPVFFQSTLDAIKLSCNCLNDIKNHIERVATKGGCTAEAIGNFNSLEQVNERFFIESFRKINNKAHSFHYQIDNDFKNWKKKQLPIKQSCSVYKKLWV